MTTTSVTTPSVKTRPSGMAVRRVWRRRPSSCWLGSRSSWATPPPPRRARLASPGDAEPHLCPPTGGLPHRMPAVRQLADVMLRCRDELRAVQGPLKARYREDSGAAVITLRAQGRVGTENVSCAVATGRSVIEAGLHPATGGDGSLVCSGDMLLHALVVCAGVTLRAVALNRDLIVSGVIKAEGDLDVRGTLGVGRDAPVGFRSIRLVFELEAEASNEEFGGGHRHNRAALCRSPDSRGSTGDGGLCAFRHCPPPADEPFGRVRVRRSSRTPVGSRDRTRNSDG